MAARTTGPPAVIDNGTGYTKMGFAGNVEPQYIIPTVTASTTAVDSARGKRDGIEDLDFYIGDKALNNSQSHQINYPIRGGISTCHFCRCVCGAFVLFAFAAGAISLQPYNYCYCLFQLSLLCPLL